MKKVLIGLFILGITTSGFAQDYVFRVMLNKGTNTYGVGDDQKRLVTGTKLLSEYTVVAGEGSYIALLHSSGVTMEIKEPGTYKVSSLETKVASSQSTLMQKYTQYVVNNISDENQSRLSATGAVTRGFNDIKVYMLQSCKYFGKDQILDWESIPDANGYLVVISDKFGDELIKKEVKDSQIELDFSDAKLKNEELIIVNFSVKGEEIVDHLGYGLQPLKDDELVRVKGEVESLKSGFSDDTPLKHLVLASYFEENGLYSDAITHYIKAKELSTEVEKIYTDFLVRAGLKDKEN